MKGLMKLTMVAFAATLSVSCGHKHDETTVEENGTKKHEGEIYFSKMQAKEAGLQTERVVLRPFSTVIPVSGRIQAQPGDEQTVVATSDGVAYFAKPSMGEGTAVKRGETLVTLSAHALKDGDPVVKAKVAYDAVEAEYRRAEKLVADRIVSEKAFEEVRMRYETAKAAYEGLAGKLNPSGVSVTSPMTGYIKSCLVSNGEYLTTGQPVAVVAQNRHLQLRADVPENYFGQLRNIRSANFRPAYSDSVYSLAQMNGKLLSYGKATDSGSPYIPVIFEFDNVGDVLPGAFADIYLIADSKQPAITLPVSALTEEQGMYFVYVQETDEVFRKQEVVVGQSDGLRTEIRKGLTAGDVVVTEGAYLVRLASMSRAIPEHTHNH